MPTPVTRVVLFVASPSDVQQERDSTAAVVTELNSSTCRFLNVIVERVAWETHCHPAMGRPQDLINAQIGAYDIFVGIMWKRFGTPTGQADSGTEEEFNLAYDEWKRDNKLQILFYFSQAKYTLNSVSETEQLGKVLAFKEELASKGLVWDYPDAGSFPNVFRPHLITILFEMFKDRYGLLPNLPLVESQPAPPPEQTMTVLNRIQDSLRRAGFLQ